jgi:hypothetical protein
MDDDALPSCKLLATQEGQELIAFTTWRDDSFDVTVLDSAQRVWGQQGARRAAHAAAPRAPSRAPRAPPPRGRGERGPTLGPRRPAGRRLRQAPAHGHVGRRLAGRGARRARAAAGGGGGGLHLPLAAAQGRRARGAPGGGGWRGRTTGTQERRARRLWPLWPRAQFRTRPPALAAPRKPPLPLRPAPRPAPRRAARSSSGAGRSPGSWAAASRRSGCSARPSPRQRRGACSGRSRCHTPSFRWRPGAPAPRASRG